jgi:hypothetical protein
LRIISDSNLEIQNVKLYFKFGATAIVHVGRYVGDATAYSETLTLTRSENQAALTIAHINPKQEFDVEFLVASYRAGNVSVDMAEPGVTLRNATLLQEESSASRLVLILVGAVITFILLTWLIIKVVVSSEVRRALEADSTSDQVAPLEPDNNSR